LGLNRASSTFMMINLELMMHYFKPLRFDGFKSVGDRSHSLGAAQVQPDVGAGPGLSRRAGRRGASDSVRSTPNFRPAL
jgi:hypothetical protein